MKESEGVSISEDAGAVSIRIEGRAFRNLEKLRAFFDSELKGPLSKVPRESFPKVSESEKEIQLHEVLFFLADGLRGNPPSVAGWWLFESRLSCLSGETREKAERALEAISWE